ncbi:MAG: hypothetical protein CME64_03405 [Halobacteriovoraceae bacterium]|nr:hypothetical protein [Halobacteriovoraceae bacterium]|tara:strand:- start:48279 stop:49514 length:1236 start_codon:yes stop_codon:yes gene_type:complete
MDALITNDATVLGLLFLVLGTVFYTETLDRFAKFYAVVPALLLCYFIPGIMNSIGLIDGESSKLYYVASRYLLPATLVLLTLGADLPGVFKLGPKALIMFLTGTLGIILGGPVAILFTKTLFPEMFAEMGAEQMWRGMTTVAGSWIGGGANQASMKEIFEVSDQAFSIFVVVDIMVANVWMAVLLILAGRSAKVDKAFKADTAAIFDLKDRLEKIQKENQKTPSTQNLMIIAAVGFVLTGLAHLIADNVAPFIKTNYPELSRFSLTSSFFWLIVSATTFGVALSFTKARKLEYYGASRVGSVMLYVLIATIGMHMNVTEIFSHPGLFIIGFVWMLFHAVLMLGVGRLIKAPLFFIAVGSQANVGGAASAPVVASVFHQSLASVGVLLAVLGYVLGTYGAWLCAQLMRWAAV